MLTKFLISRFIKDYHNVQDEKVRESYGYLGGFVGIILNILLSTVKLIIGLFIHSIAVIADAFNNLSDVASSVITILGFKLASKPADKDHPFGHGRIEYISGLIVSFMVILVGIQFVKASFQRIRNPQKVTFDLLSSFIILLSILMKIWLSRFNNYLGKAVDSKALQASSFDALSDVFTSSTVLFSIVLSKWVSFPIDGYIGIVVSLFILYSGISLIKDTLNPLLGEAPDPRFVKKIGDSIMKYEYITGVHDIIVHNYGPGRCMVSVHAEVPCDISVVKIHEIIDKAEKEISKELNIFLVIHMDPINTDSEEVAYDREELLKILKNFPSVKSIHDFRVVGDGENKNLIFDVVVSDFDHTLCEEINKSLKKLHPHYNAIITVDRDFTSL